MLNRPEWGLRKFSGGLLGFSSELAKGYDLGASG